MAGEGGVVQWGVYVKEFCPVCRVVVLFTSGSKTNTHIAGTALLWRRLPWIRCSYMNARESPRPARMVGAWPGPFDARASRPGLGPARGVGRNSS